MLPDSFTTFDVTILCIVRSEKHFSNSYKRFLLLKVCINEWIVCREQIDTNTTG